MTSSRWQLLREIVTAEGWGSVINRLLDRWSEAKRRARFRTIAPEEAHNFGAQALIVLGTPPAPRLGGAQGQLFTRLATWRDLGQPYAVLYPESGGWRLEVAAAHRRGSLHLAGPVPPSATRKEDRDGWLRPVASALELTGASLLHLELVSPLPRIRVDSLHRMASGLVLSIHDFSLFCPRPHLLEHPSLHFCDYCRDLQRCTSCLRAHWPVDEHFQRRRRAASTELLQRADAVIFPSEFLARRHRELFPHLDAAVCRVIPPALPSDSLGQTARGRESSPLHAAFVGSFHPHKGSRVFSLLVEREGQRSRLAPMRWTIFGGGSTAELRNVARLPGVRIRGYHRFGSLPGLLDREEVDVALILSIVPEAFSLTLSEARRAGVPVIAFDHGAVAERIRADGGGVLVPLEEGATGVSRALLDLHVRPERLANLAAEQRAVILPEVREVAREYGALYRQLSDG